MNPNYTFDNVTAGKKIIYAITPQNNAPFLFYTTTFDLDDGVTVNYKKFETVVAKIK